ncbi:MAG: bifunctional nuclease family protein [Chthonomonadales bacterium]|nr:bifunctional nuclease family protein [Chthonomonadales bacterium]
MGHDFKDLFGDWEPPEEGRRAGGDAGGEPENRAPRALNEKEMTVIGVFEHEDPSAPSPSAQTFVLLQDGQGRKVPIWIGRFEAMAISMAIESEQSDRPMTHDLFRIVIERLGAEVERIIVDDLWQDTFYAKITLARNGTSQDIDCRPSDAVAIALRFKAPIYMAEAVIESVERKL